MMKVIKVLLCLMTAVALTAAVFGCTKTETVKDKTVNTTQQESETIAVKVIIDGSKGEDKAISAEAQLEMTSGSTAYDALKQLCDSKGYEITGDSSYVKSIGGLGEGSLGSVPCGWMFIIDGNYPTKAADQMILENGNEVVWEFAK